MNTILDWAEVWAIFIPFIVMLAGRPQPVVNRPVILYLWLALMINLFCNLIWKIDLLTYNGVSYNGFLYNVHSMVRFLLFDIYLIRLRKRTNTTFNKVVRILFLLFIVINFVFFEKFYDPLSPFSSLLLSVESVMLLILCLQYYLYQLSSDIINKFRASDFWMVTGLSIYVVINFFIFLLYDALSRLSVVFAIQLWFVHNISYVVFNIFIAKSLYESQSRRY